MNAQAFYLMKVLRKAIINVITNIIGCLYEITSITMWW